MRIITRVIILALVTLIAGCIDSKRGDNHLKETVEERQNDLTKMKLLGKVRSLRELTYKFGKGFEEAERDKMEEAEYIIFNEEGNKTGGKVRPSQTNYHKSTYKRDKKGNKIEKKTFYADGSISSRVTYRYNEKGQLIEENEYKSDNVLWMMHTYKYNNTGNRIELNAYNPDSTALITFKYNDRGQQIEEVYYDSHSEKIESTMIRHYDEKGNEISMRECTDGIITWSKSSEYKYDSKHNWVKLIEIYTDRPTSITEREIIYYD